MHCHSNSSSHRNVLNSISVQASVPFGVMMGYIIASVVIGFAGGSETCYDLLCWRWPFIIEVILIAPLSIGIFFIPKDLISVKVIHGNSIKRKNEIQLHVKTVLKSASMSSLGEKKERSRGSFNQMDMTPLHVIRTSSSTASNKSLNSTFPSNKTPLLYSKINPGNSLLDADTNILNYNSMSNGIKEKRDAGKIETVKVIPNHSSLLHPQPSSNSTILSKDKDKDKDKNNTSIDFIEEDLLTLENKNDSNLHNTNQNNTEMKSTESVKDESDFHLSIPILQDGKYSTDLNNYDDSEKYIVSEEDGSDNETHSEAFLSPEKSVEIHERRRLRNQVRHFSSFSSSSLSSSSSTSSSFTFISSPSSSSSSSSTSVYFFPFSSLTSFVSSSSFLLFLFFC